MTEAINTHTHTHIVYSHSYIKEQGGMVVAHCSRLKASCKISKKREREHDQDMSADRAHSVLWSPSRVTTECKRKSYSITQTELGPHITRNN